MSGIQGSNAEASRRPDGLVTPSPQQAAVYQKQRLTYTTTLCPPNICTPTIPQRTITDSPSTMSETFDHRDPFYQYNDPEGSLEEKIHRWTCTGKTNDYLSEHLSHQLYSAISQENEPIVRMLLDAGVETDLVAFNNDSFSCLQTAALYGHRAIARMLWDHVGPDARFQSFQGPNTRQPYYGHGLMPSCLVIAARNGHVELVGDFLDWYDGWWHREKCMALYDAAAMWRGEVVGLLLVRISYDQDVVQVALQRAFGPRRSIWPDSLFQGPEIRPVNEEGEIRMVERLIEAGADPNRVIQDLDVRGRLSRQPSLPIHHAYNRFDLLRAQLEKGADPNLPDEHSRTVLHKIAELFDQPFLEVRRYKGFEHRAVIGTDQDGSTDTTSSDGGSSGRGGNRGRGRGMGMVRGRGIGRGRGRGVGTGRTQGIHHQRPRRFFLTDRSVLSSIYPLSSPPYIGNRPTKSKTQETNLAILHLLFQHSASPTRADTKGETPLHLLASTGSLEAFRLCLFHCEDADTAIHTLNAYGESPLHYAAAGGNEAVLSFLLDQGLDPNQASDDGWTPFLCALHPVYGKSQTVAHRIARCLLGISNNPAAMAQVVTKEGWSPMHALATPWDDSLLHFCEKSQGGSQSSKDEDKDRGEGKGEENGRSVATRSGGTGTGKTTADISASEESLLSLTQHLLSLGAAVDPHAEWLRYRAADATRLYGRWGGRMRISTISAAGRATVDDHHKLGLSPCADEELTPWWWARVTEVSAVEEVLARFLEVREAMEKNLDMAAGDMEQMEISGQIFAEALTRREMERMEVEEMEKKVTRGPQPVALVHSGVCWPNGEVRY